MVFGISRATMAVYPKAIDSQLLFALLLSFIKTVLGKSESQIAYATSICSDDINSVELPRTDMIGPFNLGGLDGFPFVGRTGMEAFSHHIPDDGMAFIFFGPHVGVGAGEVGTVKRPGQSRRTACCGAAAGALQHVLKGTNANYDPILDYQQQHVFDILFANKASLLAAPTPHKQFELATEFVYEASLERMQILLTDLNRNKTLEEKKPAIIAGGILINEDDARGSKIALKYLRTMHFSTFKLFSGADVEGAVDLLPEFEQFSATELARAREALHVN